MRRETTNDDNVQMSDVLCDACASEWTHDRAMVEGHQGSCICGPCLTIAYIDLVIDRAGEADSETDQHCVLCLEDKPMPMWQSPIRDEARFCRQCVKRAAGVLHKEPDINWSKPQE